MKTLPYGMLGMSRGMWARSKSGFTDTKIFSYTPSPRRSEWGGGVVYLRIVLSPEEASGIRLGFWKETILEN